MDYPKSVPNVGLVNGKFVDENTVTGAIGSLIPAEWGNAVTDELLSVIRGAELEPKEVQKDQLYQAIQKLVAKADPGRFLGVRRIRTTQVYYSTPGTKKIRVRGEGGGGAGGGAYSTAAGQISAGTGGGAGAYFDTWITGGFDGVTVTIGKGGLGVLAARGGSGGTTSFGFFAAAPGGYGGGVAANAAPPMYQGRTPNSEIATGGTLTNAWGQGGGGSLGPLTTFVVSGEGGPSRSGAGGNSISQSSNGILALAPGAGGGGAVAQPSYPAHLKGGDGADGWVEIEEWT